MEKLRPPIHHQPIMIRDRAGGEKRVYVMAGSYLASAGYSVRAGYRLTSPVMPVMELAGGQGEREIKVEL